MQLTRHKSIRGTLTAVTAVLVGSGTVHTAESAAGNKIESSILLYSETDRVQAAEAIFGYSHPLEGDKLVSLRLSFDALTGPSPNGAAPSSGVQTFTRPSGQGSYTVQPGETPYDDTFRDTRFSLDGTYSLPLNRLASFNIGGHISTEHDYTSFGGNAGLSYDLFQRNTTISFSSSFSHDLVRPEGGPPVPLSVMTASTENERENESEFEDDDREEGGRFETKNVIDAVAGLTQVLNRETMLRLNYSFSRSSGYLNDPYKILSVVQNQNGSTPGDPISYVYESRPEVRTKNAVFAELRRYLSGHTIDLSYRYFWDDWGIESHTVNLFYRIPLPSGHALMPHVRWYKQTGADFFNPYLVDGSPTPTYASADYRLAPFHALTFGLEYSIPIDSKTSFSVGGEYYHQMGDISPPQAMGALSQYDLFPELKAIMIRAGVTYDF